MMFPNPDDMAKIAMTPVVTLREYVQQLIDDLTGTVEGRFTAQDKAVDTAFIVQDRAVQAALHAQSKAIDAAFAAVQAQNVMHVTSHDREHQTSKEQRDRDSASMDSRLAEHFTALNIAQNKFEANVILRFDQTNQWREQSKDRENAFALDVSLEKEASRLESLIIRVDNENREQVDINRGVISDLQRSMIATQGQLAGLAQVAKDVRDLRDYQNN